MLLALTLLHTKLRNVAWCHGHVGGSPYSLNIAFPHMYCSCVQWDFRNDM